MVEQHFTGIIPPQQRNKYFGWVSAVVGVGTVIGTTLGGLIAKSVDSSEQGRIQGGSQSIQALARVIGSIIGGQIYVSFGHASTFFMGMILIAAAILVLYK